MRSSIALLLLSGLVSTVMAAPSKTDAFEITPNESIITPVASPHLQESHSRVLRNVDKTNGFSLLAIGVFGAFVKYMAYHFITKNAEGGEEKRSIDDTLLDLTRITFCLSNETEVILSNFHLHCFFPSYFSRRDNEIISGVIWGSSEKEPVELSLVRREGLPELKRRRSRDMSEVEEQRARRVRRKKPAGTEISLLALASFGAFFFYFAYFNITKYLGGGEGERSLSPGPVVEYLGEVASILQCLQEEDFISQFRCF